MSVLTEYVLIAGVFLVLFVSLILLLVYGASAFGQFYTLGGSLSYAFDSVLASLVQITGVIVTSLQKFGESAFQAFQSTAVKVGQALGGAASYLENELGSTITKVGSTVVGLVSQVARTLTVGPVTMANNALQIINQIGLFIAMIAQSVINGITAIIVFIVNLVSFGFNYLLEIILCTIGKAITGIEAAIKAIENLIP
jgi:hypothetical protein